MASNISTLNTLGINNHLKVMSKKMDTIISDLNNPPTPIDVSTLNKEETQLLVKSTLDDIDTKLGGELLVNLITDYATETTLSSIDNLLDENNSTGGFNVSITALDGEKITNTTNDTKRGLDVNIINTELSVNVITDYATETTLSSIDTKLGEELSVNVITGFATETTLGSIDTKLGGELLVNVITDYATETTLGSIDTKLGGELLVNVITGFATEETLIDTYNLLNDNTSTAGLNISINNEAGDKITGTNIDTKKGLDVNIINTSLIVEGAVDTTILKTNSTIYDLTDDSPTMTGGDNRYESDRNRPNSWLYSNVKSQGGSSLYWYSNSSLSPQGVQQFNITYSMIENIYCVVSINKTSNNDTLPIMGLYSPSDTNFYTSRWVFTIDPSELLLQNEKVLLYTNNDPTEIYKDIRHIQLLLNVVASQGPRLPSETIYLCSTNAPSAQSAGAISYNIYNTGFILDNGIHNDYEFTSGIKSKRDLLLSELNNVNGNLGVNVSNVVGVVNTNLDTMTFTSNQLNVNVGQVTFSVIDDKGTKGLNVINYNMYAPVIITFTQANVNSITGKSDSIDLRGFKIINIIATDTHSGGGSHNINVEYSTDNSTWFNSPNVITGTATAFSWDYSNFCVPYMRLSFNVSILTLNCFICLK